MSVSVRLDITCLSVGRCRHPERMVRRDGRWRVIDFPAVATLIRHPSRGAVLLDTGYAEHFHAATEPFPERLYRWATPPTLPDDERLAVQLGAHGVDLDDVHTCIISHGHADHVAGLIDLPRARFVLSRAEHTWLRGASRLGGLVRGLLPALLPADFDARIDFADDARAVATHDTLHTLGPARDLFGDGSLLALSLPGHTPGQLGLLLSDAHDREVLLCADAAWTEAAWREGTMPSRLASLAIADHAAYRRTIRALASVARARPDLVILPSHCATSLARYRCSAS